MGAGTRIASELFLPIRVHLRTPSNGSYSKRYLQEANAICSRTDTWRDCFKQWTCKGASPLLWAIPPSLLAPTLCPSFALFFTHQFSSYLLSCPHVCMLLPVIHIARCGRLVSPHALYFTVYCKWLILLYCRLHVTEGSKIIEDSNNHNTTSTHTRRFFFHFKHQCHPHPTSPLKLKEPSKAACVYMTRGSWCSKRKDKHPTKHVQALGYTSLAPGHRGDDNTWAA